MGTSRKCRHMRTKEASHDTYCWYCCDFSSISFIYLFSSSYKKIIRPIYHNPVDASFRCTPSTYFWWYTLVGGALYDKLCWLRGKNIQITSVSCRGYRIPFTLQTGDWVVASDLFVKSGEPLRAAEITSKYKGAGWQETLAEIVRWVSILECQT